MLKKLMERWLRRESTPKPAPIPAITGTIPPPSLVPKGMVGISMGRIAFAALTNNDTIVLFLGADPMLTSLGMMISHPPSMCGVVRNMALMMMQVRPQDADFLTEMAEHGGVGATEEPFSQIKSAAKDPKDLAFTAEVSLYEAAHMCITVMDTYQHLMGQIPVNNSIEKTNTFWSQIWDGLPDNAKMSVLYEGNDTVN